MICPLMSRPGYLVDCVEDRCPSWRGYCMYLRQRRPEGLQPRIEQQGMVATDCPKCGRSRELDWRETGTYTGTTPDCALFSTCYRCGFAERVQALDERLEEQA